MVSKPHIDLTVCVDKWDPGFLLWDRGDIHSSRAYGAHAFVSMGVQEGNRGSRPVESVRSSGGAHLRDRCRVLNRSWRLTTQSRIFQKEDRVASGG